MKQIKKQLAVALSLILVATLIPISNIHAAPRQHNNVPQYNESSPFYNGSPSPWAHEQVTMAMDLGLVPQSLQSNFTSAITRAEFAALAVNLYQSATGNEITGRVSFTDTNDINVQKVAYIGIVHGVGNNRFNPDGKLTREQAAVMLSRLFRVLESHSVLIELPQVFDMPYLPGTFADYNQISSWARDGIAWAYVMGIMRGTGNRMFSPHQQYTREQSIVTILRLYEMVDTEPRRVYTHTEPAVRVIIYIPDIPTATALEFIYEDDYYRYYLPSISSEIIMLTFEDGTVVSLRDAIEQEKITVGDLKLNGLNVISIEHDYFVR